MTTLAIDTRCVETDIGGGAPLGSESRPGPSEAIQGSKERGGFLEKVHRYVWPEKPETPVVAFEQKPCKEIPITEWIIHRVRRLSFFNKKKGKVFIY